MYGRESHEMKSLLDDGKALQDAGAFALVAECVTSDMAQKLRESLDIPVIGIGSSWDCDGQIIVTEDLLGLTYGRVPSFVPQKAELGQDIVSGVKAFKDDIHTNYKALLRTAA